DVNKSGRIGFSPLHSAALGGHSQAILLLHKNGANIEQPNSHGSSPLHQAVMAGKLTSMLTLLNLKADYNKICCQNCNATPRSDFGKLLEQYKNPYADPLPGQFTNPYASSLILKVRKLMHLT